VPVFGEPPVPQTICAGDAANPTAPPGHLCVYAGELFDVLGGSDWIRPVNNSLASGASSPGAIIESFITSATGGGFGSWAVTAEAA
jgi:hypothetical protein